MKFGLIANLKREGAAAAVKDFIDWAKKSGNELILSDRLRDISHNDLIFYSREELAEHAEVLVSMGGDGTILATARAVGKRSVPILGINLGSVGFLTQHKPDHLRRSLDRIIAGDYQIQERMMLKAEIVSGKGIAWPYALNDIVIDNGPVSRIIDISLTVNGENIVTYKADGLVLATPTGSTAYSLAVGGPITHPSMHAILASPISSFSLTTRPMVLAPDDIIEVRVGSQHEAAGLTLDGQVMVRLHDTDIVRVTRAEFTCKFIVFAENSFYKVLKNKLHWGFTPSAE
jgi:NAD+ kinase